MRTPLAKRQEILAAFDGSGMSAARFAARDIEGANWQEAKDGTPQGGVISPLLANIYLNPLDWLMAGLGFEMVRYADDMVVLCRSQEEAVAALEMLREWMAEAGLTLHPEETRTVDMNKAESHAPTQFSRDYCEIQCPRFLAIISARDTHGVPRLRRTRRLV